MTVHMKIGGSWVEASRPYLKRSGLWTPVKEVYVKRSGSWVKAYEYDVTPPNPPEISLELVKTTYTANGKQQTGRHVKVGVRGSAVSHDPTLKRIRVLTTYAGKAPTTYAGGTYHSTPDKQWPDEPWSEYYYNGYLGAPSSLKNSSTYVEREFPVNATNKTVVEPGVHHFTAWSEDINGNWSVGTAASITVPKNLKADRDFVLKEGRFQPNTTGTWNVTSSSWAGTGTMTARVNPDMRGLALYGSRLNDAVGLRGTPTIRSAQIYVIRDNDDGEAQANVHAFWSSQGSVGGISGTLLTNGMTKLGTIGKGERKWFQLPESWYSSFNNNLKSIGFNFKDPSFATSQPADYASFIGNDVDVRAAELHIVWEEAL